MFPYFSFELESKQELGTVKDALLDAITANPSYHIRTKGVKPHQIMFEVKNDSIPYHNSFFPIVKTDFYKKEFGTSIVVNFRLRMSIRIILYIYTAATLVSEIAFLNMFFKHELASPLYLILPLFLALFATTMSFFGLRLSSKPVKEFLASVCLDTAGEA